MTAIQIGATVALDEQGRKFPKDVTLIQDDNKNLIEFGVWERYNLSDLQRHIKLANPKDRFYLDLMGRNHTGSPVYITITELRTLLDAVTRVLMGVV